MNGVNVVEVYYNKVMSDILEVASKSGLNNQRAKEIIQEINSLCKTTTS